MSDNLDTLRKRAELPNALHGCTSNPCGSVVCQTARDRDALLSRLEQAEQAVERAKAECARQREHKGIFARRATEVEQAVQRVREVCESDSYDMHKDYGNGELAVPVDSIMNALDSEPNE